MWETEVAKDWSKPLVLPDGAEPVVLRSLRRGVLHRGWRDASGEIGELRDDETHLIPRAMMALQGHVPDFAVFGDDYDTPDGTEILSWSDQAWSRHLFPGRLGGLVPGNVLDGPLLPSDVVQVIGEDGTVYRMRLVRKTSEGGVLKFEALIDDAQAVVHAGVTDEDYTPSYVITKPAATLIQPLDIPILRDADDGAQPDGGRL